MLKRILVAVMFGLMGATLAANAAQVIPKQITNLCVNGYCSFPDPEPPTPTPGAILNPSRAGYFIGGSPRSYCTDAHIAMLATYRFRLAGVWDGWQSSQCTPSIYGGRTMAQAFALTASSSRLNEVGVATEQWAYIEPWFPPNPSAGGVDNEQFVRYNAANEWLRLQSPNGPIVPSFWNSNPMVNLYPGAPDYNGESGYSWSAQYWGCYLYAPNGRCDGGNSGYAFTGVIWDDLIYHPGTCDSCAFSADWNRDGVTDSGTNQAFWPGMWQGQKNQQDAMIARYTGKRGANISQFGNFAAATQGALFTATMDYGVMETQIGTSYAPETWGGTAEVIAQVARMKRLLKSDGRGGFGQVNIGSNGMDPRDRSNAWRAHKFAFALAMVLDTDYAPMFTNSVPAIADAGASPNDVNILFWFDYWGVDPVTRQAKAGPTSTIGSGPSGLEMTWLQEALGDYTTTANGILLRKFKNGFCAVAPSNPIPDNGPSRQLLPADIAPKTAARVFGLQDTANDNGASFSSPITMPGRSGICMPWTN